MRSFSVRPARLILVPSTLQSHALVPFRPTSSSSAHPVTYPFTFPSHIIPISPSSAHPVTYPFTFPSHIIPISPSSHTPFYLSVPHHPRQPSISTPLCLSVSHPPRQSSSHIPFYLSVPHPPRQSSSHIPLYHSVSRHPRQPLQSHALLPFRPTSSPSAPPVTYPFTFPSHIIPVSPPVTYPFTFSSHIIPVNPSISTPFYLSVPHPPRQSSSHIPFYLSVSRHPRQPLQSHTLLPFHFIQHFVPPLRFFSPCPRPSGKVPGISAKTVHFPPRPAGAPAPHASLAALAVSPSRESAGLSCENGSLSPVA